MFKYAARLTGLFFVLAVSGGPVLADGGDGDDGSMAVYQELRKKFASLKKSDVRPTAADGIYEVTMTTERGSMIGHATRDGRYFIDGDLIDVARGISLTEMRRKEQRLERLAELGDENMIVFKAPNEQHVMTVFTDIDCGYCRKLHREMDDYHARGITVRYLFYPRSGPNTPSFKKAKSVWCADDRNAAMTRSKNGQDVNSKACGDPVLEHYNAGQAFGVRGTPSLILDDGSMQSGYIPADRLLPLFKVAQRTP